MIFESFFLKGRLININKAIRTEVNIRIGIAYIGLFENIETTNA
jgi:hypothetical protein